MDALHLALLVGAAFTAGTIDAVAGGGGLMTVPVLLSVGLPPAVALGTNKGQSAFGTLAATVQFWRTGALDRDRLALQFVLGFAGSLAGAALVLKLSPAVLRPLVLVLLVSVAAVLTLRRDLGTVPTTPPPKAVLLRRVALLSAGIGMYDGFFGPGTGTFLILSSVALLGDPMRRASANAKVVNLASNLAALSLFTWKGVVRWDIALPMAAAQLAGGTLGARLTLRGGDRFVRRVVLAVVVALVVKLAYDLLRG